MAAVQVVNGDKVQAGRSFSIASSLQDLSQPSSSVRLQLTLLPQRQPSSP